MCEGSLNKGNPILAMLRLRTVHRTSPRLALVPDEEATRTSDWPSAPRSPVRLTAAKPKSRVPAARTPS